MHRFIKITRVHTLIGISIFLVLAGGGCRSAGDSAAARADLAAKAQGTVKIGTAADWTQFPSLWDGIALARDEINAAGGINGRQLEIVKKDDHGRLEEGEKIALEFTEDLDIVAVLGHAQSYISKAVSIIYEYYGILMFTPLSSDANLTRDYLKKLFRNIPSDTFIGEDLAQFCKNKGWKRVMIYNSNDDFGDNLANIFEMAGSAQGLEVLNRKSYSSFLDNDEKFRKDLVQWRDNYKFDAIFLAGLSSKNTAFIKTARKLGITCPIVNGNVFDMKNIIESIGESAEELYLPVLFSFENKKPPFIKFVNSFKQQYNRNPDQVAAQGYEALKLLAAAFDKAGSTVPETVAKTLKADNKWPGLTQSYSFSPRGDIVGKRVKIIELMAESKVTM